MQDLLRVVESDGGRAGGEDGAVLQAGTDEEAADEEEEEEEDEVEENQDEQEEGSADDEEEDVQLEAVPAAGGRGKAEGGAMEVRTCLQASDSAAPRHAARALLPAAFVSLTVRMDDASARS